MQKVLHVILTGGVGSRLWPLSRKSCPKQYLQLFSDHSLFELAVKRNASFVNGLIVVGNQNNQHLSSESLIKLNVQEYTNIVEATPRNTAAAIAFAALAAQAEDILLVTPADHIIMEGKAYNAAINSAIGLAKEGALVTFGVKPTRPETGYGYIESDGDVVLSFKEKPERQKAEEFLEKGNFLWNSGMFCFKAGIFLEELKKYAPKIYFKSKTAWNLNEMGFLHKEPSLEIPSISVDYALMEKSEKIKVVEGDFEWSDMGSFEALYYYLKDQGHPVDDRGNITLGLDKHVSFLGLSNCILISTSDATLVLSIEASQNVSGLYQELEKINSPLIR